MENNIGATDRLARIAVGAVLSAVGLASLGNVIGFGTTIGAVATLLGVVLVATGFVRICLLYRLLGVDTSDSR
ncbi:Protein of unknown function [Natronoarchaeum philippinense]|uniref:Inner membrane protein YgaP-like transmembrane domain-containing protein n=1 Tax=Natronoarchaeum philippinense TaxID=558529 RepID=A0A285P860_NATPI|nr:DUF2892 domain-containing protein [Natronoarchaeum philippinense]SNZ17904.1 Protein of unknown function [Natronoarchaeum philippinense]